MLCPSSNVNEEIEEHLNYGSIRIISVSGTEIGVYQLPTHQMMTALAFAIANPSVFRDALDAFATKVG